MVYAPLTEQDTHPDHPSTLLGLEAKLGEELFASLRRWSHFS
jgi:hypothetical protein